MRKDEKNRELSIIIPVYNVESYLEECLESIPLISLGNQIEIILVNDGSTDNSLSICQTYSIKYPNIKLISQKNQGLSEARNTGIKNAQGKYLLFLDSDDFLKKDTLLSILEEVSTANKDFYIGRSYKYYGNSEVLSQINYELISELNPQEAFLKLNAISNFWFAAWLVIINREFLLNNNLYFKKGILHEDELWVPSVFIKANSIGFFNYGFYCYRINREGSIVSKENIRREFDKLIVAEELGKYSELSSSSDKIISQRRAALIYGIIVHLLSFKNDNRYLDLYEQIKKHLTMLNHHKYRYVYLMCKLIGIKNVSRLINKKW